MHFKVNFECEAPAVTRIPMEGDLCIEADNRVRVIRMICDEFKVIDDRLNVSQCLGCKWCKPE